MDSIAVKEVYEWWMVVDMVGEVRIRGKRRFLLEVLG